MKKEEFIDLLEENESDYLEFKQEWHESKCDLLHDILCLANACSPYNQYIIFGVSDDHCRIGIENDPNRRKDHDVQDWLSKIKINHSLRVRVDTIKIARKSFDILEILNVPLKPFYLLEEYRCQGEPVKAFHIYYRRNSQNTNRSQQADDDSIEYMWRERFGIDLVPLERFHHYLDDIDRWKKTCTENNDTAYYYEPFPAFKIVVTMMLELSWPLAKNAMWVPRMWLLTKLPIQEIEYTLIYSDLRFQSISVWWGDNKREPLPLPEIKYLMGIKGVPKSYQWQLSKTSLFYKISRLADKLDGDNNLDERLLKTKIEVID